MLAISRFYDSARPAPAWLLTVLLVAILAPDTGSVAKAARDPDKATLLALGNWDRDTDPRKSPRGDAVLLLNSRGKLITQITRSTVKQGYAGCRGLSASRDGSFFVVCDCSGEGLSMYRTSNGVKLWSLSGFFVSAVFADGLIYALSLESVYAIDHEGTIVKHSRIGGGGIDIAFDPLGRSLWVVGLDVKKYSPDLKLLFEVKLPLSTLNSGAFSVDLDSDGSVWVAGKNAYEREGRGNRLVKVSPAGKLLKVIDLDFCPQRVRVDKSDGSVWTTGRVRRQDYSRIGDQWPETVAELDSLVEVGVRSYTRKYDSEGNLLVSSTIGGTSIEVDPTDGSVWIAGDKSILHCSSIGENLTTYTGGCDNQKSLAIVP